MTTTSNAIPASSFLPPAEHDPSVPAQSPASYEDLMRENAKLRAAIRAANGNIERMLGEIDVMVAKLKGVTK